MLISIMPRYVEGIGDCCRVKRSEGEILHKKKLNTIFKEVFWGYCADFSAIKKITTNILNQKTLVPIYASSWEIMIPIKVRQPLFRGDCCYGYVNIFQIKKVFNQEILLVDGERIAFLDTKRAIEKRESMAEALRDRLPGMVKAGFLYTPGCNLEGVWKHRSWQGQVGEYGWGFGTGHGFGLGLGVGREQYPSMSKAVEEYILNLMYWAIEDKELSAEVLNRN